MAAEAGKSFGAAAAAMSVSPADVCPPGDARCAGFVGQQNNQAAAILRAGLVVAYANDLVDGGGRGKSTTTNESPSKSAAENAAELPKTKVEAEIAALKKIGQNPDGPVLGGKAPNRVLNQQAVDDLKDGILPGFTKNSKTGMPDEVPRTGVPREMAASINPSATAEDFASRLFGGATLPTNASLIKDCPGCWTARTVDGADVTYRPANTASGKTSQATASIDINFATDGNMLNGGKELKLKFPQR